jgi:hypothetical protein
MLRFVSMPAETAAAFRADAPDANGQPPERRIAAEDGMPCRHCQRPIKTGEAYLTLAYRPFPALQPYAECGPIFLHAEACARYPESALMPSMFATWRDVLLRGYGADDRIVYGTGIVVPAAMVERAARRMLAEENVRYIHMRSSTNNCYQLRIERG